MTDKPDMCAALRKWADALHADGNIIGAATLAAYAGAWEAERAVLMPCGHHPSLMLKSAETGADLYCELCDAQSGRRDAEQMEAELQERIAEQDEEIARMRLCQQELSNIATAKRFDRSVFDDDSAFADWAQSRCRYVGRGDAAADIAMRTGRQVQRQEATQRRLWLWRNFVDGKPEYWAFDNAFPVHMFCDDPQTLGEPCGYALLKPSRAGRTDVSDDEVLRRIVAVKETKE